MSGHSKWATTKHKKAILDSRRAKSFAKLIKNIEVAARGGGADLAGNPALELAVTKAKKTSVPADNIDLMAVLDAGAEEVKDEGESFEIISEPQDLPAIRAALVEAGIDYESDDAGFVPSMHVELDVDNARKFMKLYDALEDLDDVQNIYSNADLSAEVLTALEED